MNYFFLLYNGLRAVEGMILIMRIAFLSHTAQLAGAEKILVNMVENLRGEPNIELFVFAYGVGPMERYCKEKNINYVALESSIPWYIYVDDTYESINSFWELHLASYTEIKSHFIKLGIDLVVINTMATVTGMLVAANLNIPSILWIHGIMDHKLVPNSSNTIKNVYDKLLLYNATRVIVPSEWVKNHFSFFRDDIVVIPNFTVIPEELYSYPDPGLNFVFTCMNTWDPLKGIDTILQASKILHEKGISFELRLYGSGGLKTDIEEYIEENDLKRKVSIMNREVDLKKIFKSTNALISASQIESFGMTLIEAMAHGRPILVSKTSGHKEILDPDENYGLFAKVGDPVDFANKMEYLIKNYNSAKEMGRKAHEKAVSKYNGIESAAKMKSIIQEISQDEITKNDFEIINRYQNIEIVSSLMNSILNKNTGLFTVPIEPDNLEIIGEPLGHYKLNSPITYKFSTQLEEISALSFMVGTHQNEFDAKFRIKIYTEDDKIGRESQIEVKCLKDNSWIMFEFDPIENANEYKFYVLFEVEADFLVSVYESIKNSYFTKLYRKTKWFNYNDNIYCKVHNV